jgi:hypothetical protein
MLALTPIKPNLVPKAMRWVSTASAVTLATVLIRLGELAVGEVVLWRGTPDTAIISGKKVRVSIGRQVDAKAIDRLTDMLKGWDGFTITLGGRLGGFVVDVDIDAYADWRLPVEAGIADVELIALAEPRGVILDYPFDNFYDMIDVDDDIAGVVWGFLDEASGIVFNNRRLVDYIGSILLMRDYDRAGGVVLWGGIGVESPTGVGVSSRRPS